MRSPGRAAGEPDRRVAAALVTAQLLLLAVLGLPARRGRPPAATWPGRVLTAVALAGLVRSADDLGESLTPSPIPAEGARLHQDGLYARVRHPIYSFVLLGALGRALTAGPRRVWAALLLLALLTGKARWEEAMLTERFPGYAAYAASTPRFVPRAGRRAR